MHNSIMYLVIVSEAWVCIVGQTRKGSKGEGHDGREREGVSGERERERARDNSRFGYLNVISTITPPQLRLKILV